jgi:ATP-dependent Zn protease
MTDELTEIRRAAYHEAGHAVINLIYGLPFRIVSLKTETESSFQIEKGKKVAVLLTYTIGTVFPEERLYSINKTLMSGILDIKEALSLMGGPVAEIIFWGKYDDEARIGARQDIQAIAGCCRAAMSGSSKPEEWKELPDMEQSMITAITVGANRLLKDNWTSVEAIAEILIEKKELDYREASRIAEAKGLSKKG